MKAILALLLVCAISVMSDPDKEWKDYKTTFGKDYTSTDEEVKKEKNFNDNLQKIEDHNARADRGEVTYRLGVNPFTDMDPKEFQRTHANLKVTEETSRNESVPIFRASSSVGAPLYVDWRTAGVVTAVKDQGNCGSCYAFSTVGALESCRKIAGKLLLSLSEQQVLDCTASWGNLGCDGGYTDLTFDYIKANGLEWTLVYPYKGVVKTCTYARLLVTAKITGYSIVDRTDAALMEAVSIQPISVRVDATTWQSYSSGVLNCPSAFRWNHAVLLVGYGTTSIGIKYWLIKNSWGTTWGESGYIRLRRDGTNQCGILTGAIYLTGCS